MNVANFGQAEKRSIRPTISGQRVPVDPLSGIGVAANLHVLGEFLVAEGTTLGEQGFDLPENVGVALDRR